MPGIGNPWKKISSMVTEQICYPSEDQTCQETQLQTNKNYQRKVRKHRMERLAGKKKHRRRKKNQKDTKLAIAAENETNATVSVLHRIIDRCFVRTYVG